MIPIIDQFIKLFDYENEVIVVKNSVFFGRMLEIFIITPFTDF